jgi:hypothetical protein
VNEILESDVDLINLMNDVKLGANKKTLKQFKEDREETFNKQLTTKKKPQDVYMTKINLSPLYSDNEGRIQMNRSRSRLSRRSSINWEEIKRSRSRNRSQSRSNVKNYGQYCNYNSKPTWYNVNSVHGQIRTTKHFHDDPRKNRYNNFRDYNNHFSDCNNMWFNNNLNGSFMGKRGRENSFSRDIPNNTGFNYQHNKFNREIHNSTGFTYQHNNFARNRHNNFNQWPKERNENFYEHRENNFNNYSNGLNKSLNHSFHYSKSKEHKQTPYQETSFYGDHKRNDSRIKLSNIEKNKLYNQKYYETNKNYFNRRNRRSHPYQQFLNEDYYNASLKYRSVNIIIYDIPLKLRKMRRNFMATSEDKIDPLDKFMKALFPKACVNPCIDMQNPDSKIVYFVTASVGDINSMYEAFKEKTLQFEKWLFTFTKDAIHKTPRIKVSHEPLPQNYEKIIEIPS